jgi:tripartite tricarboxylate transporter TctB family protein
MTAPSAKRGIAVEQAVVYGLLTALGLFTFVVALGYGLFLEELRIGPGLVPAVVGGLITLIAGWELVATLRGQRTPHDKGLAEIVAAAADAPPGGASSEDDLPGGTLPSGEQAGAGNDDGGLDIFGRTAAMRGRQLVIVFIALTVAVLLVPLLGFLVSFFLLSLFISAVVERRSWISSAIVSFAAVAVIYLVFVVFLRVPLPAGLIGIGG